MNEWDWRLLIMPGLDGATQMAVDDTLLDAADLPGFHPTLRLYSWEPACLSLGYAQPISDIELDVLSSEGWDLVRRPTGGRAILHTDELTYSLILPLSHPLAAGNLIDSYRRIASGLLASLERLGCEPKSEAAYDLPPGSQPHGPVCFEVPSRYEITVAGKKLIGSAQARRKSGMLQHGSLPLWGDLTRITRTLSIPERDRILAAERLLHHASTRESVTGVRHAWETAAEAFKSGFEDSFQIRFFQDNLTDKEWLRASSRRSEKYGNPRWTERV